jgi:hypothetical protein
MENPIDTYILGGGEVLETTGFGDYGDTIILNEINEINEEGQPIVVESNVFVSPAEVMNNPTEDIPTDIPTENSPEDNPTKLNKPTQNFMSNANPFLIGIGIVVGLVLLGDFFKSKSDV